MNTLFTQFIAEISEARKSSFKAGRPKNQDAKFIEKMSES